MLLSHYLAERMIDEYLYLFDIYFLIMINAL